MAIEIDWVEIPEGEFLMGLSATQAQALARNMSWLSKGMLDYLLTQEAPQRKIHLAAYYISRYPITWGQYLEFADSTRRSTYAERPEYHLHPVTCSWHDAHAFCCWIGGRLPTSYEWEKAARGVEGRLYPWGNQWDVNRGNFGQQNARGRAPGRTTSPVDAYPEGASPYGVQDAVGNCFEWTMSFEFTGKYQSILIRGSEADRDALHPWNHRITRVMQGGMSANAFPPHTGFRPVLDEKPRPS